MLRRRLCYLTVLVGCLVFFLWHRQWLSWVLLVWVLCLPWLSLLVSLPAMLGVKATFSCAPRVQQKEAVRPMLRLQCRFPMPLVRCKIQVRHPMNGDSYLYELGEPLQTDHCGVRQLKIWRLWVYDYLGLFRRRLRKFSQHTLVVVPERIVLPQEPPLQQERAQHFKPQNGGFSEHHELRLFSPGDELRRIHWKLSAKAGKLLLRQPMQALRQKMVVSLVLSGTDSQLDKKLGQLLWVSEYLLANGCRFEICCVTGQGLSKFSVTCEKSLEASMDALLASPAAASDAVMPRLPDAGWQHHIGGDAL